MKVVFDTLIKIELPLLPHFWLHPIFLTLSASSIESLFKGRSWDGSLKFQVELRLGEAEFIFLGRWEFEYIRIFICFQIVDVFCIMDKLDFFKSLSCQYFHNSIFTGDDQTVFAL